ncbi:MAG: phosphoribosylformylglycinamidine synthase subunit PurQ [Candidatus Dadabacteria bacterium]|nr:phosphoribosylformylglycinamidine synthase subunit PurQ [Candidatus Dadabacteria bacterium]NIQ14227.1 phosphoribosylformylglycinamidine synthase subunit PurQ [Candidatus Dadabacteria bacterium]
MPNFGVLLFPGSNCDHDCYFAIKDILGQPCSLIWHEQTDLDGIDCIVIPGGFSYGDYLRTGAIARFSPVMNSVVDLAKKGVPIIGICNGFQILVESGLLPGSFIHNTSLKFVCKWVYVKVKNTISPFTFNMDENEVLRIPVANSQGNYFLSNEDYKIYENDVVFEYCDSNGDITGESNPNGSTQNIAGISNGNVLGMMPHPERSMESLLGSEDGRKIFESVIEWMESNN